MRTHDKTTLHSPVRVAYQIPSRSRVMLLIDDHAKNFIKVISKWLKEIIFAYVQCPKFEP